jgi:hypothetical protein
VSSCSSSAFWVFYTYGNLQFFRRKLVGVKRKVDRRDAVRERKALSAARIEHSIEKELVERLKSGAYGDAPLNVNESIWKGILDHQLNESVSGKDEENLGLVDDETDEETELEQDMDEWGDREFVSDISGSDLSDLEDAAVRIPSASQSVLKNLGNGSVNARLRKGW